ncbi:MAG: S-layer homology domain-containing protein [Clostridia bacterium]|nr:S-layer homology domain-containing protein [Clostridia bacterium]
MKKIISFLLVIATLLSCFVLTVSADDTVASDEGRLPFEDVKSYHWFYTSASFCYANNIIKGMNEYTFGWNGDLTRAQFVTMLASLEGVDTSSYTVDKFTDVKSNHWYSGAIAWAYSKGIVSGMTETTFQPNGVLTRAQMAMVMKNYMTKNGYAVEINSSALNNFTDKPKTEYWYYDAMVYAVSAGLISGNSNGTLAPTGNVTRAQAAIIFHSFMLDYYYGECEHEFAEASCTESAVCTKCGLADDIPMGHFLTAYDCVTGGKCTVCGVEVEPSKTLHNYREASCTAPKTCELCGVIRGEALGHKWNAATCTTAKTCSVCKKTEGSAKGHNWKAATCTEPKTCVVCNLKEGKALEHNIETGICDGCGRQFYATDFNKITKLLKTEGQLYKGSYVLAMADADSITRLMYHTGDEYIVVENTCQYKDGDYDVTTFKIPKYETWCDHTYVYYDVYKNTTYTRFKGSGMFYSNTFTKNSVETFSKYEGTMTSGYPKYVTAAIHEMLDHVDKILAPYGYNIKGLGFVKY